MNTIFVSFFLGVTLTFSAAAQTVSIQTDVEQLTPVAAQSPQEAVVVTMMERVQQRVRVSEGDNMIALVRDDVMPMIAFERMTASAVGPAWRSATPAQRNDLMHLFEALLTRTYAGALTHLKDQTMHLRKGRTADPSLVRTEVVGKGRPFFIDYRLDLVDGQWRIINVAVEGIWMVESYRGQFRQEIARNGVEGLLAALRAKVG